MQGELTTDKSGEENGSDGQTTTPPRSGLVQRTLHAYSGKYRLEGDKWVTKVDAAWNVSWVGTDQERFYKFDGKQLHVISQWQPGGPQFGGRMVRGFLAWEREQ